MDVMVTRCLTMAAGPAHRHGSAEGVIRGSPTRVWPQEPSERSSRRLVLPPLVRLRWKISEPRFHFGTVSLESLHEFCRRLLRVLADRAYSITSFKVGYVATEISPHLNPLGPQVIKGVHGHSYKLVEAHASSHSPFANLPGATRADNPVIGALGQRHRH
jgi:hypothetical protein